MKVLFISHFREGSDWSDKAAEYAFSMIEAGIDLVIRNINLSASSREAPLPLQLSQLEKKENKDCDICVQYLLPHLLSSSTSFKKNIAIFSLEALSVRHLLWFRHLQLMDEIWVPNSQLKNVLQDSKINIPVTFIPQPSKLSDLTSSHRVDIPGNDHSFKFYYVGEILDRDNIESVIKSFHSEFHRAEQVSLVIKPVMNGYDPQHISDMLNKKCKDAKDSLRIYKNDNSYKTVVTIAEPMVREGILALHNTCDCFVSASHADSWSAPAVEAMAFGNTPILSAVGGSLDYIDSQNPHTGSVVNGHYSICNSSTPPFPELQTGKESWFIPCEDDIKGLMRYYYENRDQDHRKDGREQAKKFSRKNVGSKIKEHLNGCK